MTNKTSTRQGQKATAETAKPIGGAAEKASAEARKTVEEGTEQVRQGLEAAASFNQGNIEAMVASSTIAAKAMENMTSEIAAYSKKSYEDGMAAAKELGSCRSVAELVEKQAAYSKSSIESFVSEASKLNEMYAAAAQEAFAPLSKRFSAAADLMKGYRF